MQDGAELPPTFDWPHDQLVFAMAGGHAALIRSAEGAEDDETDAVAKMDAAAVGPNDVVIGLAASGTTPYTVALIRRATELRRGHDRRSPTTPTRRCWASRAIPC